MLGPGEFVNSGVLENPTLSWLGDIFVWPEPMPFANVFSIGDMLIVIGAFYGANKICGSRLVKRPWVPPTGTCRGQRMPGTQRTPRTPSTPSTPSTQGTLRSRGTASPRARKPLSGEAR